MESIYAPIGGEPQIFKKPFILMPELWERFKYDDLPEVDFTNWGKVKMLDEDGNFSADLKNIPKAASHNEIQDLQFTTLSETEVDQRQEYDDVAHAELINKLDILINKKSYCTKYKALNLQTELTVEEKKILEKVFDIIKEKEPIKVDGLISAIIREYKEKKK